MNDSHTPEAQHRRMRRLYRTHSAWYDATRWAFLFGRKAVLRQLPALPGQHLLEIGCGTGHNLRFLAGFHTDWQLIGLDVSPDMLAQSAKAVAPFADRVQLYEQPYGAGPNPWSGRLDHILFSYSLTLFNPGWEAAIARAAADLKPGGHIAVVDFHDTRSAPFRAWMTGYAVRLDAHLLPALEAAFQPVYRVVKPAWGGLWQYFMFVGRKI